MKYLSWRVHFLAADFPGELSKLPPGVRLFPWDVGSVRHPLSRRPVYMELQYLFYQLCFHSAARISELSIVRSSTQTCMQRDTTSYVCTVLVNFDNEPKGQLPGQRGGEPCAPTPCYASRDVQRPAATSELVMYASHIATSYNALYTVSKRTSYDIFVSHRSLVPGLIMYLGYFTGYWRQQRYNGLIDTLIVSY